MDCGEVWLSGPKSECRIISVIDDYSLSFIGQPENIEWLLEDLALSISLFIWFGSSPPPPVSKLERWHTGRLRKRDNLLTGEGEGGKEWAKSYDGEEAWSSISYSMLSGRNWRPLCSIVLYMNNFWSQGQELLFSLSSIFGDNNSFQKFWALFPGSELYLEPHLILTKSTQNKQNPLQQLSVEMPVSCCKFIY